MGTLAEKAVASEPSVLAKAVLNAGREMGLSQADIGTIIGRERTTIKRYGIDPAGKDGELAAMLVRCYRALHVLVGGEAAAMKHWMSTFNRHTGGVPREQMKTVPGLATVLLYLDALRGKV